MTDETNQTTEQVYGIKYEAGRIGIETNDRMGLRFGAGLEFYYGNHKTEPLLTQIYPIETNTLGINVSFSPHLDIKLSEKFFIDFNPALMLVYNELEKNQTFNPSLPTSAQKQTTINLGTGGFVIQIGVGYIFKK